MQAVHRPAYRRTTATMLARLDYQALAQAVGVTYQQIAGDCQLDSVIPQVLQIPGPVLTQVVTDYRARPIRWIEAVKHRYTHELSFEQKVRTASRLGARALDMHSRDD